MAFTTRSQQSSVSSMSYTLSSILDHLSGWLAVAILGALMLWRQDSEALWASMGSLVNAGLSISLKNLINQPRPFPPKRSDPGMPSSHAQMLFYVLTFLILSMVKQLGTCKLTLVLGFAAAYFSYYLAWLRVTEKYHTTYQVLMGAFLGTTFSILWHWSWEAFLLSVFESMLWVRIFITLGAGIFWLILLYVTRSTFWPKEQQ